MNAHRYDILAIDVDGTLLDAGGRLPEANREAVRFAADAGLDIVLCTGRSLAESQHIVDELGLVGAGIFVGGAVTVDLRTGESVRRSEMEPDLVRPIVELLNKATGHLVLLLKDRTVTGVDYRLVGEGRVDPASEWWFAHMPVRVDRYERVEDDPHPHDTVRISIVTTAGEMRDLSKAVNTTFGNETFIHDFPVTTADGNGRHLEDRAIHLMEIFRSDTNKWTALEAYAKSKGVPRARIAAIGDEINDLAMIENAGLGVAMANGVDAVKRVADRITTMNGKAGVAHAVNQILKGEW